MFKRDACFLCAYFLGAWVCFAPKHQELHCAMISPPWSIFMCENFILQPFAFVAFFPATSPSTELCLSAGEDEWERRWCLHLCQPGCSEMPFQLAWDSFSWLHLHFRPKLLRMKVSHFGHCNGTLNQHHWKPQSPTPICLCGLGSIHHQLVAFICSEPDFSENWTDELRRA